MQLIITEAKIDTNSGVSQRTGKPYSINRQWATLEFPNGERRNIEVQHNDGAQPLQVGHYRPKPSAYYLDAEKNIVVSRRARNWEPVETAKATKAS